MLWTLFCHGPQNGCIASPRLPRATSPLRGGGWGVCPITAPPAGIPPRGTVPRPLRPEIPHR